MEVATDLSNMIHAELTVAGKALRAPLTRMPCIPRAAPSGGNARLHVLSASA